MRNLWDRRLGRLFLMSAGLFAIVSGITYAATSPSQARTALSVIQACSNTTNGDLRVVSNNGTDCRAGEAPITWDVVGPPGPAGAEGPKGAQGDPGKDGQSVTSATLPVGDGNCPTGGSSFTSVSGTTYACTGAKGDAGDPGTAGANGKDGMSVMSQSVSSGDANCPGGGSKFTAANDNVTYACNGQDATSGKTILVANVAAATDGSVSLYGSSDATAVFHPGGSDYLVEFGRNVAACAATATSGLGVTGSDPRSDAVADDATAVINFDHNEPDYAEVFWRSDGASVNTSFHLILVC